MCFRTNLGNRVSGYDCVVKDNDIIFISGKSSKNRESVSGGVQSTRDNLARTCYVRKQTCYEQKYYDKRVMLGTLTSTIQAILPAHLQFPYLQQQQIATLKRSVS